TGKPKGACITHASLSTHTAALVHHELRFDDRTRALGVLPLTHSFGIRMAVLAPFYAGGRVVLLPRFDAARSLEVAREESVTFIPAVPTMFAGWARTASSERTASWSSLDFCLSAGAPLPDEIRAQASTRLGADVRQGYGLTEATFSAIDAPMERARPGTVGHAVWGVEIAVADPSGRHLPAGEDGEVLVRGQNVMSHYLDDPSATKEAFRDGWLRTGDVGRLDEEGRLTIVDRTKDLILRGGNNVYPSEVEDVLHRHPSIAEVAVVGLPEAYYGEEVVAVVRLVEGAALDRAALEQFARAHLAAFKVPRAFALAREMPLGPSGKVLKRLLRDSLQDGTLPIERCR
ncbi:MAG: AMP-binding protein, partial [Polyangiaceae bacterium]|nr:AMP-binding protein [Polyangiaceae bacterium]